MPFQTKIQRARFTLSPFSSEQMEWIGDQLKESILARIRRGETVADSPAKDLRPGYSRFKQRIGRQGIRDLTVRGRTLRSMKVVSASENRAVIGFVDPQADRIMHVNNLRDRQFGISPNDRKVLNAAVLTVLKQGTIVRFEKAA